MKVFLLEDDFHYSKLLTKILKSLHCDIRHTYSDAEEEGILEAALASGSDLYLLDIELFGNKTAGLEFAKRLREAQEKENILYRGELVYISGQGKYEEAHQMRYPTPSSYIDKPGSDVNLLREHLNRLCIRLRRHITETALMLGGRRVSISEVIYVQYANTVCKIYLTSGKQIIVGTPLRNLGPGSTQARYAPLNNMLCYADQQTLFNPHKVLQWKANSNYSVTLTLESPVKGESIELITSVRYGREWLRMMR
ncbi:MAG: hypothetical protein JJT94_01945 [Bernardetiaceae bacterium]|nr:hypothetical protein [Bernardetiaceae bacterium]